MDNTADATVRAVMALLLIPTAITFAAVPVENLTAEMLGIPAEDFISPEEAI